MKTKIFGSIAVIAIAVVSAFNLNMNTNNEKVTSLSLANVLALAGENDGTNKCIQNSKSVYNKEMCSTYPVKYLIKSGVNYSLKKDPKGYLTRGKKGFEGTITNECASSGTSVSIARAENVNC